MGIPPTPHSVCPLGEQSGKESSKPAQGALAHSLGATQQAWDLGLSGPCQGIRAWVLRPAGRPCALAQMWGSGLAGYLPALQARLRASAVTMEWSREQETRVPASFLASYPHPCFFPGPGLKRDRCGQRHGGPLLPTGVSLACPAGPWSQPLLQPVLPGRPALSRMAVGMAVGQAGPLCLTISLAPVGVFLDTRRSRAGDGGQGGWMGSGDGKRGGRAGKAAGELGEGVKSLAPGAPSKAVAGPS